MKRLFVLMLALMLLVPAALAEDAAERADTSLDYILEKALSFWAWMLASRRWASRTMMAKWWALISTLRAKFATAWAWN